MSEGCQLSGEEHAMMFKIHFVYNNPLAADTQHNHNLKAEMWSTFEMLTQSRPVMMTHLWEFDEQLSDSETLPSDDNHQMRHIAPPSLWSQHHDVLTTPMMRLTVKTFTADAMCLHVSPCVSVCLNLTPCVFICPHVSPCDPMCPHPILCVDV